MWHMAFKSCCFLTMRKRLEVETCCSLSPSEPLAVSAASSGRKVLGEGPSALHWTIHHLRENKRSTAFLHSQGRLMNHRALVQNSYRVSPRKWAKGNLEGFPSSLAGEVPVLFTGHSHSSIFSSLVRHSQTEHRVLWGPRSVSCPTKKITSNFNFHPSFIFAGILLTPQTPVVFFSLDGSV